ncbi:MAG TPA: hypothetical protein VMM13_09440 [Euzebya sp.]|nr:hypothetical protein [Euzebya sp.]
MAVGALTRVCCMMGGVRNPPSVPSDPVDTRPRSGTAFVIATGVFLVVFLVFLVVVSPRLQNQLGLTGDARAIAPPAETTEVPLTLDGREVGVAIWDAQGVCAEIHDASGTIARTCAQPDPLRPIWALDAPDEADPPYVIVGGPPAVASVAGITTDGQSLSGLTQARELPVAWTLISLPPGAAVAELIAYNSENADLGNADCSLEVGAEGPQRLNGGCVIPRQD